MSTTHKVIIGLLVLVLIAVLCGMGLYVKGEREANTARGNTADFLRQDMTEQIDGVVKTTNATAIEVARIGGVVDEHSVALATLHIDLSSVKDATVRPEITRNELVARLTYIGYLRDSRAWDDGDGAKLVELFQTPLRDVTEELTIKVQELKDAQKALRENLTASEAVLDQTWVKQTRIMTEDQLMELVGSYSEVLKSHDRWQQRDATEHDRMVAATDEVVAARLASVKVDLTVMKVRQNALVAKVDQMIKTAAQAKEAIIAIDSELALVKVQVSALVAKPGPKPTDISGLERKLESMQRVIVALDNRVTELAQKPDAPTVDLSGLTQQMSDIREEIANLQGKLNASRIETPEIQLPDQLVSQGEWVEIGRDGRAYVMAKLPDETESRYHLVSYQAMQKNQNQIRFVGAEYNTSIGDLRMREDNIFPEYRVRQLPNQEK